MLKLIIDQQQKPHKFKLSLLPTNLLNERKLSMIKQDYPFVSPTIDHLQDRLSLQSQIKDRISSLMEDRQLGLGTKLKQLHQDI